MFFKRTLSYILSLIIVFSICVFDFSYVDGGVNLSASAQTASENQISFETGTVSNYIGQIQIAGGSWSTETKVDYGFSTDQKLDGSQSIKINFKDGAASSHHVKFNGLGAVAAGEYFNFNVYVPEDSAAYKLQLCYRRSSNKNIYGASVTYDFSGTNTMNSRKKGEWVTLSGQIPTDETEAEWVTIKVTAASGSTNTGTVFYVDSYSVTDSSLDNGKAQIMYGFEAGPASEYIRNTQTNSYQTENNVSYEISSEQKADGSNSSLKVSLTSGAAKGQYINLMLTPFKPDANKWYNLKVFVPEGCAAEKMALVYTNSAGTIKKSDTYYFSDNNQVFTTDEIRAKGKWVTLSMQIPVDTELKYVGLYIESFGNSTAGSTFYIDSYSVTEVALDTIRYPDTSNLSGLHNFDVGNIGKVVNHAYDGNLIRNVRTQGYQTESNIAFIRTSEQKDGTEGKSLKVTLKDGAAKGQYINFNETNFKPAANKWYNLKVFVPEGCAAEKMALVYTNSAGTIKKSDTYYFSDNNQVFTTDELREKGKWVTLSMQIPVDTELKYVGLYIESFGNSTAGSTFYIDSYSVTDLALDTIRYSDKSDKEILYSFEAGVKEDYIKNVHTGDCSNETNISFIRTCEQKETGKKSLKVTLTDGAAKAQYINLSDYFEADGGKWYNLKVFVPESSLADKIALTYIENKSVDIKKSPIYYFTDDTDSIANEIRAKGEWVTLSLKISENVNIGGVGLYIESFGNSTAGAVFYIDSYSVTDKPLDDIGYADFETTVGRYGFEIGTTTDYIRNVQNNSYNTESNISFELSSKQKEEGGKSLKVSITDGAAKGQYINLKLSPFNPQCGKWYNLKVFVPTDSKTDKICLTYANSTTGTITRSKTYYFANSTTNPIDTDEIQEKGKWITLSLKIADDISLRCVGLYTESFSNSNEGATFYVDSYSVTDSPLNCEDSTLSGEKTLDSSYKASTLTKFTDLSAVSGAVTTDNETVTPELANIGQDESSLKLTVTKDTYLTFGSSIDFTSGNWINIRLKSENLDTLQFFYTVFSTKKLADVFEVGDEWTVISFKKPVYKNSIGLFIKGNGSLYIDGIYSSSEPFDIKNQTSSLEYSSSYYGLENDYIYIREDEDVRFIKSKFKSNVSDADIKLNNVGTGKTARLKVSGCTVSEYKIVMFGDIDGDAKITASDSVEYRKALLGIKTLENEFLEAADLTENKSLDILDYISHRKLLLEDTSEELLTYSDNIEDHTDALREYLEDIYGNYTLAGQQFLTTKYPEITCIYDTTSKLPSLMGFDLQGLERTTNIGQKVTEAIKWYNDCNGIVTLMWHWAVPRDINDLSKGYSSNRYYETDGKGNGGTEFSIKNAVTSGTAEYEYVLQCVDNMAIQLKALEDAGVPVLWRPLHEAAGNWYWWGANPLYNNSSEYYIKLWNLLYDRLENHHGLKNLIWVWNGQDAAWMPDTSTFDIASYDNYAKDTTENPNASLVAGKYNELKSAATGKMLALSEAGQIPTVNGMYNNNVKWLYWVGWYTEYTYKSVDGQLVPNDTFNTAERYIQNYNSEYVITLDELPLLSRKNKRSVPEPIKYFQQNGHIEGESPQWENGKITLEAELADLTNCKYYGDEKCSGFATVLWVGKDNKSSIKFTVDVPEGQEGNYIAEVHYAGVSNYVQSVDKWHVLTYNDSSTGKQKFPTSTERFTSVRLNITLKSGTNTLGFLCDSTPSSDGYVEIDCIKLIKK